MIHKADAPEPAPAGRTDYRPVGADAKLSALSTLKRIGNRDSDRDRVEHRNERLHRESDIQADRHGLAVRIGNRGTPEHRNREPDPDHDVRPDLLAIDEHLSLPDVSQHVTLRDHESIGCDPGQTNCSSAPPDRASALLP